MHSGLPHPAWFEIDLDQFKLNLSWIQKQIGSSLLCCCVKANAYGHGLIRMALAAQECGADYFCVARLQEGVALRRAGIRIPILVLGAFHEDQIADLIRYDLEFTISSRFKAELVAKAAIQGNFKCTVHVEVDTGMRRTGVRIESALGLMEYLLKQPCFHLKGIYSHFAMSETPNNSFTQDQIERFLALKERAASTFGLPWIWHLANSGGISFYPESHLDMVRAGLLCYGLALNPSAQELKPILSLKAKVSYFKVVEANQGISYGHTYQTQRQSRIATVPVGYGDGYRRDFSNRMKVLIRGQFYPIAGSVCMDQFMVDLGDGEAYVGDEVVLVGKQGGREISLVEMAHMIGTDPREVLCHFNERIPRIYIEKTARIEKMRGVVSV